MRRVPLIFPFFLALIFSICGTVFLPHIRLLAFSPFLAILYNKANFIKSLWIASLCGLAIDLLSSEFHLGVHALNYCLTTLTLYKQKRHFFEDKPLALSLFTVIISITSTILQYFLICIFDHALPLSKKLAVTDLIIMPLADAAYAFLWFFCPIRFYIYIKKIGWRAFFLKFLSLCRFKEKINEE